MRSASSCLARSLDDSTASAASTASLTRLVAALICSPAAARCFGRDVAQLLLREREEARLAERLVLGRVDLVDARRGFDAGEDVVELVSHRRFRAVSSKAVVGRVKRNVLPLPEN